MNLIYLIIMSFFTISILGTLLHFTHNVFKKGLLLHMFSAVNESTWEHMKLLLGPTILVGIFQYFVLSDKYPNLFNAIMVLLIVETLVIPTIYEPLRLIFHKVNFILTIIIFYLAILTGIIFEYWMLNRNIVLMNDKVAFFIIILISLIFFEFTYYPPKFFIFRDPITKRYGHR